MNDVEIDSLLDEAGYRFDTVSGRYMDLEPVDDAEDYATEEIAGQLQIPVDDLLRWEEEQTAADDRGGD
jgi:hypothetical protein